MTKKDGQQANEQTTNSNVDLEDLDTFEKQFYGEETTTPKSDPAPRNNGSGDDDDPAGGDGGEGGDGADDGDDDTPADGSEDAVDGAEDGEGDGDGTNDGKGDDDKPKPQKRKLTAKERVQQAVTRQRDAEAERDELRARLERLEKGQPQQQGQQQADHGQQPAPQGGGEFKPSEELTPENVKRVGTPPDPEKYEYGDSDSAYVADLATHRAYKKLVLEQQQARELADHNSAVQAETQAQQDWAAKKAKAVDKYPDYHERVTEAGRRGEWPCTLTMAQTIRESDVGTDIAYHLATNPKEAGEIAQLSETGQARAIGRLEARFSTDEKPKDPDKKPSSEKPKKIATDAPDPGGSRARGGGGRFEVPDDTDDLDAFEKKFYQST